MYFSSRSVSRGLSTVMIEVTLLPEYAPYASEMVAVRWRSRMMNSSTRAGCLQITVTTLCCFMPSSTPLTTTVMMSRPITQ